MITSAGKQKLSSISGLSEPGLSSAGETELELFCGEFPDSESLRNGTTEPKPSWSEIKGLEPF